MLTKHAQERMKQRGFTKEHIDLILHHGVRKRVGSAVRHQFTKKIAHQLRFQGYPPNLLDKCKSSYVVSHDDIIITIAHMH